MQQREPLGFERGRQNIDSGYIAARPSVAFDQPKLHWIAAIVKTIGVTDVAAFAASAVSSPPVATNTLIGLPASSAASLGSCSY